MPVQPYRLAHTVCKLEAQPIAVEARIVAMHDAVERWRQDDDVLRVVVQRLGEVLNMVRFHNALATIRLANALARHLTAVIVQSFQTFTNRTVKLPHMLHP